MDTASFFRRFVGLILLAAFQIFLLNRIVLFGYVTPLFYIWMIARFDSSMSRSSVLLWAFSLGLVIDISSGTPGLNAASATLLAMFQPSLLKMFVPLERHVVLVPGASSMGGRSFAGYLLLLTVLHHTTYFILRSIPLGDWTVIILKIVLSTLLTFVFMLVAKMFTADTPGYKHS